MEIIRLFCPVEETKRQKYLRNFKKVNPHVTSLSAEKCYHIQVSNSSALSTESLKLLRWILKGPQGDDNLSTDSHLSVKLKHETLFEIGPRFTFSTAESTNTVSICHNVGLKFIDRIEMSVRYLLTLDTNKIAESEVNQLIETVCDRMTQCRYTNENIPKNNFFECFTEPKKRWYYIPVMEKGAAAIRDENTKLGLAFDEWDINYYTRLFQSLLKRNPTNVELFDCAQCNSEHSRHWFFRGKIFLDGVEEKQSLIEQIIDTQKSSNPNNTVKFSDNSSAIKGFTHKTLHASSFTECGKLETKTVKSDLIFTAETHNMPTALSPFSGATTGTGGRIRDVQSIGRGGLPIAGTVGYCVGMLNIPGYSLPYETKLNYPASFSTPLTILIEASNGTSDYGNKFGEPVVTGFTISFGIVTEQGSRIEYVKPVLFSGGLGIANAEQMDKINPEKGMLLVKLGGPVYRIGVGGGAASSVDVQGNNDSTLDFNAVQRGDAEMENKLNRVVRACIEMGADNPILSIHDQGAGGNGNVLKELVEPGCAGAVIFSKEFHLGDPTISLMELWGAEYQENNAVLITPEKKQLLMSICERERCPISVVGFVTGDGYISLIDGDFETEKFFSRNKRETWGNLPYDMHLDNVLGKMPQKEFKLRRKPLPLQEMCVENVTVLEALMRVLSSVTVGSKRFLTNKVDRCVTGLIAQQQCIGPLHTPLADFAVTAVSQYSFEGIATSIGTQPIKGLVDNKAGARMSVAEAISNLVFAGITELADVKCSGNWMWAAKLDGEGAKLVDACKAMCEIMKDLNIAIDGGKDSLSMAARVSSAETVSSPGTLVISAYAPCPDIRVKVTPDLKAASRDIESTLLYICIEKKFRLGGSILGQCFNQLGVITPDIQNPNALARAFVTTQKLLKANKLLAGHDISEGGLLICALEMAFAGLAGLKLDLTELYTEFKQDSLHLLFAEECGWIIEVESENVSSITEAYCLANVPCYIIGKGFKTDIRSPGSLCVNIGNEKIVHARLLDLFKQWERTSFEIEKRQANEQCAAEEYSTLDYRCGPSYYCSFNPDIAHFNKLITPKPKVAVLREEGINGDREMSMALFEANFEVHDVTMSDLLNRRTLLDNYRGVIFPGGFSYADTLGSAKGWAACILHSQVLKSQFRAFKSRADTFSLGVCNGCQLMALLGWISTEDDLDNSIDVPDVVLIQNVSERFECRWSTLKISESNSFMLRKLSNSILGCWIAHGEGQFSFKNKQVFESLKRKKCIAMQYVDDNNEPTVAYPMNPNGSIEGVAGLCSPDGRHLAIMPHPERCTKMWQWPYISNSFKYHTSPWHHMFVEAYNWCTNK
ncbi:phosphoribosylformylglycinamidine synthase isoform X1 [Culex pipiens pallens]|uniref:Phosphoribosylformylglycinamidine synthase n=1 Tax=Culex pipiens TaxID=7175 RepID=A0A8D8C6R8_CULPI|nr:phosphoribosylformylglycinamidine synthase isoform X1 [Culex pipiens pallens]